MWQQWVENQIVIADNYYDYEQLEMSQKELGNNQLIFVAKIIHLPWWPTKNAYSQEMMSKWSAKARTYDESA